MTKPTSAGLAALLALSTALLAFSGGASASLPPGWTGPVQIEHANTYNHAPENVQIATAGGGRALAAWTQYDVDLGYNVVMWSMYDPSTGWSTPSAIVGTTTEAKDPAVAGWANGSFELVYRDFEIWTGTYLTSRHWQPDTGWSNFATVTTDPGSSDVKSPKLATDAQGNAFAIWLSRTGTHWDLRANRWSPGAGWGPVNASLESTDYNVSADAQIAVDTAGDAVVTWSQLDATGNPSLYANRYVVGSGWGSASLLETSNIYGVDSPALAVDGPGNAMALWKQFNGTRDAIYANHFVVGTGWGGANQVSTGGTGSSYYPAVTVTAGNVFFAAWIQGTGTIQHVFYSGYTSLGWSTPVNVTDGVEHNCYGTALASDAAGNVLILWQQITPDYLYQIHSAWWVPGSNLVGVGARLDTSANSVAAPMVSMAPDGGAAVLWTQGDQLARHIFAVNYWPPDTTAPTLTASAPSATTTPTVVVAGTTEPGATVTVGGVVAHVGDAGAFSVPFALQPGPNTIVVEASDAAGNDAYQTLTVTFNDPVPGLQSQLTTANDNLAATRAQLTQTQGDLAAARLQLNTTKTAQAATDTGQQAKIDTAAGSAGTAMLVGLLALIVGLAAIAMGFMMGRRGMAASRPAETKPAEAKPADAKPAEPPK